MIKGSDPVIITGVKSLDCRASISAKSLPTTSVGGQSRMSLSFGRLVASVTISFALLPPCAVTRLSTAAGPKAVNRG